jgi:zinc protease
VDFGALEWITRSFSAPIHPRWRRCFSVTYGEYAPSSRLAIGAARHRSSTQLSIRGPLEGENVRRSRSYAYDLLIATLPFLVASQSTNAQGMDLYELKTYQLDNGVAVHFAPGNTSPLVALQVWVGAGSINDPPSKAGLAHLVEHMLFKGSRQYGIGELAKVIEQGGGEINAWTSPDQTVFHAVLRSGYLGEAIDVLADTLVEPRFEPDELERERAVVFEEMSYSCNDPGKILSRTLMATAFLTHPYRRPVIGSESTLRAISVRDVAEFYRSWYVAPNLTVAIVGDVDPELAMRRVSSRFAALPAVCSPQRPHVEPLPADTRTAVAEHDVKELHLAVGFRAPSLRDPDVAALDAAAVVLSQRSAVAVGPAPRFVAYLRALRDATLLVLDATAAPAKAGATITGMLTAVRALSSDLRADELSRAQTLLTVERLRQLETVQGRARSVGWYVTMTGDPRFEQTYTERLRRLRKGDVMAALRRHVRADRAVVTALAPRHWRGRKTFAQAAAVRVRKALPSIAVVPSADERREVFGNGLTLLLHRDPHAPMVAMRAAWSGGVRLEGESTSGAGALLARMITRGCGKRRAGDVAARVDELGGGLAGVAGRNSFGISAEWLADRWLGGFELLAECLLAPRFDAVELSSVRQQQLDELADLASRPGKRAYKLFLRALYGDHPSHRDVLGSERGLLGLGRNALRQFYSAHFPISTLTLVLVGDFDPDEAVAAVRSRFAEIPRRPAVAISPSLPVFDGRPAEDREVFEYMEGASQAHLVVGFPGTTVADPARLALEVLGALLGGQSGRLFLELRERQGLAYQVAVHVSEGIDPGYFAIHVACAAANLDQVHSIIRRELARLLDEGIAPGELERARNYLIGAHETAMQRRAAVATAMAFHEAYGVGWRSWHDYADRVAAVGSVELLAVARTYLRWDRAVTATVRPPASSPAAQRRSKRAQAKAR